MQNIKFNRVLDFFINDLIPQTRMSVKKGNKIFGAFIIKKSNLSLVVTGTNNEITNPLYHGEISALFNFFGSKKLNPKDYYFISSHEPCSLCLSAITWSGFDNFYYFFPYSDTQNKFNIPHDVNILKKVFRLDKSKYNNNNQYWESYSIIDENDKLSNNEKIENNKYIEKIYKEYEFLSNYYQKLKFSNKIPLK